MVFQEADLPGARHPRHLLRAVRARDRGRREGASPAGVVLHPHLAGAARPARALQGQEAAVREARHRGRDQGDAQPPRRPALGRLPDDRLRRGDDGDRRQLGLVHRARQGRAARGHDHEDEPRGGRGDRPPAQAARHRRDHRHRLHRHVARAQPRRRAEGAAQGARRGPHQDLRDGDLAARAGRDDAPERDRRRARDPHEDVPDVRGRGRRAVGGDGRARDGAAAARPREGEPGARGVPRAGAPARVVAAPRGRGGPAAARARAGGRQALPLRGQRGAAARLVRAGRHGLARRDRAARAAVPRGRGAARQDRGAAHVRRGRRRRQDRLVRDLGGRRRAPDRRGAAGPDHRGRAHLGAPRRSSAACREDDERRGRGQAAAAARAAGGGRGRRRASASS